MASENTPQSTKLHTDSTPIPPGDHRKRRRNRTTQSCLNCHASKRMCDRKRPACQRCTTLGLTGLCVYEVDDPGQRNSVLDEKALLRSRIAELEGVIREMKNKPHPRWAQKSTISQAQSLLSSDDDDIIPSIDTDSHRNDDGVEKPTSDNVFLPSAKSSQQNLPSIQLTPVPTPSGVSTGPEGPLTPHFLSTFNLPSPSHSSSSSNPGRNDAVHPSVLVNGSGPVNSPVFNVDNLLASAYLGPTGFEEGIYGHMLDHIMQKDQANAEAICSRDVSCSEGSSNCGCINNSIAYHSLLELSVRLRKVVESLGSLRDHHSRDLASKCELYKKICDLDKLTSSTLGNATSPTDQHADSDTYFSPLSAEFMPSTISSNCLTSIQQWESAVIRNSISGRSDDDSFMSWDGTSRENWSHTAKT